MSYTPEVALWQTVLYTAVQDAVLGVNDTGAAATSTTAAGRALERAAATHRARNWILQPNTDFAEVCLLAGLDYRAVREAMRQQIEQAPTPEALAKVTPEMLQPKPKPKRTRKPRTRKSKPPKRSTARPERTLTYQGETLPLSAWAERVGLPVMILRNRCTKGWDTERALTQPARSRAPNKSTATTTGAADEGGGVVSEFAQFLGTGAGTAAQDRPEIDFPEKAA